MKKSIRPISVLRIVLLSLLAFFIGFSISGIILILVEQKYDFATIISLICAIVILAVSAYFFCADFKRGVSFYKEYLKVRADAGRGIVFRRFQNEVEVKYEDILYLHSEYSRNDSNGKSFDEVVYREMPYIVIELKDGSKQSINVDYYNKRQKAQIIDEIKLRAEKVGNPIDCPTGKEIWN